MDRYWLQSKEKKWWEKKERYLSDMRERKREAMHVFVRSMTFLPASWRRCLHVAAVDKKKK